MNRGHGSSRQKNGALEIEVTSEGLLPHRAAIH